MAARWKKKEHAIKLRPILAELNKYRIQAKRSVTYTDMSFTALPRVTSMITSMLKFDNRLPTAKQRDLAKAALFAKTRSGDLSSESIIRSIRVREAKYIRLPKKKYVVLSSLACTGVFPLKGLRIEGASMRFGPSAKKCDVKSLVPRLQNLIGGRLPSALLPVTIDCRGRTPDEAIDSAYRDMAIFTALLNLAFGQTWRNSFGRRKAVGTIIRGPVNTVHEPDGSRSTNSFSYELNYDPSHQLHKLNAQKAPKIRKFILFAVARLRNSGIKKFVYAGLVHYAEAVQTPVWELSYQRLWNALEHVTATSNESHEITVRRCASFYKYRDMQFQLLDQLRIARNKFVHHGEAQVAIESDIYLLKGFVEDMLLFLIRNPYDFQSREDVRGFLDMSRSKDSMARGEEILKAVLKHSQ